MANFDYAGALFGGKGGAQEPPPQQNIDYASQLFGGNRATSGVQTGQGFPDINKPPVAISSPEMSAGVLRSFMGGIPTDKKAAISYFAKQRGIPESRYTVIDGDIAYQADDGKYYKEVSGIFPTAAYYAPDVLEMVPDIAAGVATAPFTMAGPAGLLTAAGVTGATAAASNAARQGIAKIIAGQEYNPVETAVSGILSAGGELLPAGRKAIMERRTVGDIAQMNKGLVSSLRQKAGQYNIPLTPAEITGLSSLMSQQKVLTNIPESQVKMQKFYAGREAKVQQAVDQYLNTISQVSDASQAGKAGFDALEAQKQKLIQARDAAVEPIYKEAFDLSVPVDTKPVAQTIDNLLKTQPKNGRAAAYLGKMKKLLERDMPEMDPSGVPMVDAQGNIISKPGLENRLPVLQNVKFELDAMFTEDAFKSLDKKMQSDLTRVKNVLLDQMSKDNPAYVEANKKFAELSKPIDEFNSRITGSSLLRIPQDNLKNFSRRIFENPSPDTVKYAKENIVKGGGQEAWDAVVRSYLDDTWNIAKKPAKNQQGQKIDTGNTWQNILLGDEKTREAMRVALSGKQYQALTNLAEVLEAAGRVKKLGSDTAFNQLIRDELMKNPPMTGVTTGTVRAAGAVLQPQNYGKMIADWAVRRDASKNADKLADIITSPDGIERLKELKKMSPTSAKYWAGLGQLMADYGILEIRD